MGLFGNDSSSSSTNTTVKKTEYVDSLNTTINKVSNLNDAGNIHVGSLAGLSPAVGQPIGDLLSFLGLDALSGTDESSPLYKYRIYIFLGVIAVVLFLTWKVSKSKG